MTTAAKLQITLTKDLFLKGIIIGVLLLLFFGVHNAKAAITGEMDLGSSGPNVVELQTYLATNATIYPSGQVTGYFDVFTQSATERFQTAEGIVSEGTPATTGYGRVGPQTVARINTLIYLKISASSIQNGSKAPIEDILTAAKRKQTVGLPARLTIPVIDVDTTILSMGLTSRGKMAMTKSLNDVVWYNLGERPGDNGSAVIAGHHDGKGNGEASVFDNLYKLNKGDKIYAQDDNEVITTFIVRKIRRYDLNEKATEVFSSNDGNSHLNLITCDGVPNPVSKSYPKRLVVFADKE